MADKWTTMGDNDGTYTFAREDSSGDMVVVKIRFMPEYIGDFNEPDPYLAEEGWFNLADMSREEMLNVASFAGVSAGAGVELPEDIKQFYLDRSRYLAWFGEPLDGYDDERISEELAMLRGWFNLSPLVRAELAMDYRGGDAPDYRSPFFHTLAEAMDYYDIPASATRDYGERTPDYADCPECFTPRFPDEDAHDEAHAAYEAEHDI